MEATLTNSKPSWPCRMYRLPPGLKHKYSFSNWISCAFDIEPNIPIELPEIDREVVENLNV